MRKPQENWRGGINPCENWWVPRFSQLDFNLKFTEPLFIVS